VLATSRTPYYAEAAALGAEFYEDADDFCEEHPDVVVLASSILSTDKVLRSLPLARLKRSTLVVDVLSVKVGARARGGVCVVVVVACGVCVWGGGGRGEGGAVKAPRMHGAAAVRVRAALASACTP
jgi:hypothetical protein